MIGSASLSFREECELQVGLKYWFSSLESRTLFANTLRDQGKYAEAEAQYKQVIQLEENALGPEHRDTLNACYIKKQFRQPEEGENEAKALAERAAKGAAKVLDVNDPYTREYATFIKNRKAAMRSRCLQSVPGVFYVWKQDIIEQGTR